VEDEIVQDFAKKNDLEIDENSELVYVDPPMLKWNIEELPMQVHTPDEEWLGRL